MIYIINVFISCFILTNAEVIVETTLGKVAGKRVHSIIPNETYYSFLGIPYAEPPVDELRFKAPKPHHGWKDVLEATKERMACPQFYLPIRRVQKTGYFGKEDCLHLSIHSPKVPNPHLNYPAIVFLYNELFRISFNGSKDYGPDFFMNENVILITVHHRLGSLGFLSFEDEVLPGNYGLRDVILALEWIQKNIKNFGGDPSKVTLMGSQGGGALADLLLQSPKAKGLFSGVILQSGTSWNPYYLDSNPRRTATHFGEALKETVSTSSHLLKRFKDYTSQELTNSEHLAIDTDESLGVQRATVAFGPSVEPNHSDALITALPEDSNIEINVPIMIGYSSREGIESAEHLLRRPEYLTYANRDFLFLFPIRVKYRFKMNDNVYHEAVQKVKNFYFEEGYVKISRPGEYLTYVTDIFAFYSTDYAVRKYTNISSYPVYYYVFDYSGELNLRKKSSLKEVVNIGGTWGASVADELCYLFVCTPRKLYKNLLQDEDSEEIKVLKNMVRMWANFARTGNPTPPGGEFTWKPATKENKECLAIGEELVMRSNVRPDVVKFWDDFLSSYSQKAVNDVVQDPKDEL